jgi:hypothetical protein
MQPANLLPANFHVLKVREVPYLDRVHPAALDMSDEHLIAVHRDNGILVSAGLTRSVPH